MAVISWEMARDSRANSASRVLGTWDVLQIIKSEQTLCNIRSMDAFCSRPVSAALVAAVLATRVSNWLDLC